MRPKAGLGESVSKKKAVPRNVHASAVFSSEAHAIGLKRKMAHPALAYLRVSWGRCPQTPGIYRLVPETWHWGRRHPTKATSPMSLDRGGARVACRQSGFPNPPTRSGASRRGNRVWGPDLSSGAARGLCPRPGPAERDQSQQTPGGRADEQAVSVVMERRSALLIMFLAQGGAQSARPFPRIFQES